MRTQHLGRRHDPTTTADEGAPEWQVLRWYAGAAVLFFLVTLVGTDWLGLQPDLFYLGYFTVAAVFLLAFLARYGDRLRRLWTVHLWQSILVGGLVGAVLAAGVFRQTAAPHAQGWRFGFEIVWRGLVYGTVDALTLFVFPAAVAFLLMHGDRQGVARKVGFAGLTLALSMVVTATYHLGYSEFRGQTIRYPELGAVAATIPTALTGNPVGAVVTHVTMHVSAVVHLRDGGPQHVLPPRSSGGYADHGSSDLAAGLAALWLVATGAALTALVRRERRRARPPTLVSRQSRP